MRKTFTFIIISLLFIQGIAQKTVKNNNSTQVCFQLVSETEKEIIVQYNLPSFKINEIKYDNIVFSQILVPNTVPLLKKGAPEVPQVSQSIILPLTGKMELEIIDVEYTEIEGINLKPSKGMQKHKQKNDNNTPFLGDEYAKDEFYPKEIAQLRSPYILKNYRGQAFTVFPVAYNPVKNKLRIYNTIKLRIKKTSKKGINEKTDARTNDKITSEQNKLYKNHFLNYKPKKRYTPIEENGSMLIVSHPDFIPLLDEYRAWRAQCGIQTEVVDASDFADQYELKSFVVDYYHEKRLTFLLLVGDSEQVPTFEDTNNGNIIFSDPYYGFIEGDDSYPEVIVGRLSGENEKQINTQLQRIIQYEKFPEPTGSHYTSALSIASNDGPGHNNEYDFEHLMKINEDLLSYNYTQITEMYDGTQGGNDAEGNPTAEMISEAINEGVGFLNYIGHGDYGSYHTGRFKIEHAAELNNKGKLPFVISVACAVGDFTGKECLAETFMRTTKDDEAVGAVAVLGSYIDQWWNPPMAAHDEMIDILTGQHEDNVKHTFGGITINGCIFMNDQYGDHGYETTNTWNIFGDPAMTIRTNQPKQITAEHSDQIKIGSKQLTVISEHNNAKVTLSRGTEIIASQVIQNDKAILTFKPIERETELDLTLIAYNKIPYTAKIQPVKINSPYIILANRKIKNTLATQKDHVIRGEKLKFDMSFTNIGNNESDELKFTISTKDNYIRILKAEANSQTIAANETQTINSIFEVEIDKNAPNEHIVDFEIKIENSKAVSWKSDIRLYIDAPEIELSLVKIEEIIGNGDGILNSSEKADILIEVKNTGGEDTYEGLAYISTISKQLIIATPNHETLPIKQGESVILPFTVFLDESEMPGGTIDFNITYFDGGTTKEINIIEPINLFIETWENQDFSSFDWKESGNQGWHITKHEKYEGMYCAKSDPIDINQNCGLHIELDVLREDSVCFYVKTSTEVKHDNLKFMIDDQVVENFNGLSDWQYIKHDISQGKHKISWVYEKDYSTSGGEDCVWLDNIILPWHKTPQMQPQVASEHATICEVEKEYNYLFRIYDRNFGDKFTFELLSAPDWINFEQKGNYSANLQGTPQNKDIGVHDIKILVSGNDENHEFEYQLKVNAPNNAPEFESTPEISVFENMNYVYKISVKDSDNDPLEINVTELPNWLSFSVEKLTLSGFPPQIGTFPISILATDKIDTTWQSYVLEVKRPNIAPVFTSTAKISVKTGEQYEYKIKVVDENNDEVNITCIQKPEWLTFENLRNGEAILQGTPQENDIKTSQIIIEASDGNSTVRQIYDLTVTTSIKDFEKSIKVFPVPAKDYIIVSTTGLYNISEIKLISVLGKTHKIINSNVGNQTKIDTKNIGSGIYILKLTSKKMVISKQIVIQ